MPLDISGQAQSAAKEEEHAPGDGARGLPGHDELATARVHRNHEQQQRAGHGHRRVRYERHEPGNEGLKDPAECRQGEDDCDRELRAPEGAELQLLGGNEVANAGDFARL